MGSACGSMARKTSSPGSISRKGARASLRFWDSNMASNTLRVIGASLALAFITSNASELLAQRQEKTRLDSRRFYPDDPLWQDDDRRDISPVKNVDLSGTYDLVENTFGQPAR